jgi:tetratricopeptide (TPR) repeat protein
VSQLILPIGTYSDVRLAYVPLAGAVLLAARAGAACVPPAGSRARAGVLALCAGLAILAVVGVRQRNTEFRSAVALFEADLRHRPDSPGATLRLGTVYRAAQRWSDAERLLDAATKLAPESSQAWFELAVLRTARGDTEGAKWTYRQALRLRPSDAGALMNLGVLELKSRNLAAAESLFQAAYAVNPDGLLLKYNMALLDASRGRNDSAVRRLREVLEADPDLVRVEQVLSFLERTGQLPRPEEALPLAGS